mgnify:CR=1 FL=1
MESSGIHISLRAEELFRLGGFPVTNALLLSTLVMVILAALAAIGRRRLVLVPGYIQNTFETAIEGALGLMEGILGSRERAEKYLPFVGTVFLFILAANWFGLLPGIGSVIFETAEGRVPLLRSPGSDLNFTLALAVISVVTVNILGIAVIGFVKHAGKFFNFRGPIDFFIGILELISEVAKLISFSFRLFGNIFAGEILLTIIAFLTPYFIPLPFLFLETFVGFIQAFVFAMLSLVFVATAIAHE